jgi:hypothetical protein
MSSMQQVLAAAPPVSVKGPRRPPGHRHLRGSDFRWAIAFVLPYAAVLLVFVVYPFGYALWMARKPSLYADLIFDPLYPRAIVNTLLFVGLGVNVKMFLALLLAWNDYLFAAVLLAVRNMTVAVTQGQLFSDTDAPWNAMMAAAIIYVLPPIALLFALRRYVVAGLTMAAVTE